MTTMHGWLEQVTSHLGPEELPNALYNSHLVIIPAGVPRKPGMTRDDLFNINAGKSHQRPMPAICSWSAGVTCHVFLPSGHCTEM